MVKIIGEILRAIRFAMIVHDKCYMEWQDRGYPEPSSPEWWSGMNQKDKEDYIMYFLKWEYYLNQFIEFNELQAESCKGDGI